MRTAIIAEQIRRKIRYKYGNRVKILSVLKFDTIDKLETVSIKRLDSNEIEKINVTELLSEKIDTIRKNRMRESEKLFLESFEKFKHDFELTSKYISNARGIEVRHLYCNEKFSMTPNKIMGSANLRCPKCLGRMIQLNKILMPVKMMVLTPFVSKSDMVKIVKDVKTKKQKEISMTVKDALKMADEIKLIRKKQNEKAVARRIAKKELESKSNGMTRNLNQEIQYKKELMKRFGSEITLVSDYCASTKPIRLRHSVCGCEWTLATPRSIFESLCETPCPICREKERGYGMTRRTQIHSCTIEQELEKKLPKDYIIISNLADNMNYLVKHTTCGSTFRITEHEIANSVIKCKHCNKLDKPDYLSSYYKDKIKIDRIIRPKEILSEEEGIEKILNIIEL